MSESFEHTVTALETLPSEGTAPDAVSDSSPSEGGGGQEAVVEQESMSPALEVFGAEERNGTAAVNGEPMSRHAEAGRKGAQRVHRLIQLGKLYEQEHGLKRGRQRLRQLIEEGKLYEQEHGLSPRRAKKRSRLSHKQVMLRLVDALTRIARPSYRPLLAKVAQAL